MLQWACASIGAILVTLNPAYRLPELVRTVFVCKSCGARSMSAGLRAPMTLVSSLDVVDLRCSRKTPILHSLFFLFFSSFFLFSCFTCLRVRACRPGSLGAGMQLWICLLHTALHPGIVLSRSSRPAWTRAGGTLGLASEAPPGGALAHPRVGSIASLLCGYEHHSTSLTQRYHAHGTSEPRVKQTRLIEWSILSYEPLWIPCANGFNLLILIAYTHRLTCSDVHRVSVYV